MRVLKPGTDMLFHSTQYIRLVPPIPPEEVVKAILVIESEGTEPFCLKTRPYYILLLYYYGKKKRYALPARVSHALIVLRG